jgi:hypothetical protein
VIVLQSEYRTESSGRPIATNQLDIFLKIDNATAAMIAKTLNPIIGPTADHNFVESMHFLQRMDETTKKNGPGVQRMAGRLSNVSPEIRQDFVEIAGLVFNRQATNSTMGGQDRENRAGHETSNSTNEGGVIHRFSNGSSVPASAHQPTSFVSGSDFDPTLRSADRVQIPNRQNSYVYPAAMTADDGQVIYNQTGRHPTNTYSPGSRVIERWHLPNRPVYNPPPPGTQPRQYFPGHGYSPR